MQGKVYVASMNLRGKHAVCENDAAIKVNVTSVQVKTGMSGKNRRDFSPMTFKGGYDDGCGNIFGNFEAFWQSLKVIEGVQREKIVAFWKRVNEEDGAKRRFPGSKGKKVLHALYNGEEMDYITSRKKVYVPHYLDIMKGTEMAMYWKSQVEEGKDVVIFDFDGPRLDDGDVSCIEVTGELLTKKINDVRFPFGHGYIVGAWIKGITMNKFI